MHTLASMHNIDMHRMHRRATSGSLVLVNNACVYYSYVNTAGVHVVYVLYSRSMYSINGNNVAMFRCWFSYPNKYVG